MVHDLVGSKLLGIVERLKLRRAVLALHRAGNEIVRNAGVLGQERPVDVSAHDVLVEHALVAGDAVVAVAVEHAPQRGDALAQVRAAGVVLIAHDGLRRDGALNHNVANEARVAMVGVEVHEREPLDLLVRHEVARAQQLVAAAHGSKHAAVLDEGPDLCLLGQELVAHNALLAV